jgi:hypothetical protein
MGATMVCREMLGMDCGRIARVVEKGVEFIQNY